MSHRPFQVLPFTLTELFVLLFFVLALALANETRKRGEAEREQAALQAAVAPLGIETVRAVAAAVERDDSIPDDFQELVRRAAEPEGWRREVQRQLREAGRDSAWVANAATTELVRELTGVNRELAAENRGLEEATREVEDRVERLERFAGLREDAAKAGVSTEERLLDESERLLDETERLDRENRDLRAQVANLVRRTGAGDGSGGTGVDHPPCWADAEGRIEYAFEATLHTTRVDLRPIWPPHRDRDAREILGMREVAGQGLTYHEFSRRALPILRWSQRQEPGCRHFVRILDRVDGGKDAFKAGLLTVERYFYKLLVD